MKPATALLAALLALGPSRRALAAPAVPSADAITWHLGNGAESCDTTLLGEMATRLSRAPFFGNGQRAADVTITRSESGWYARVLVRAGDGVLVASREFVDNAPRCDAIVGGVGFVLEFLADSMPANAEPSAAPPTIDLPPIAVASEVPGAVNRRLRLPRIVVAATSGFGLLPGVEWGARLALDVPLARRWRIVLGTEIIPRDMYEDSATNSQYSFDLGVATADLCATAWRRARVALLGCGGVQLGAIQGAVTSSEIQALPTQTRAWFAVTTSQRAEVRIAGPVWLEIGLSEVLPVTRYRYEVAGLGYPWQPWLVALTGYAGLGLTL